jgi:hypothetical protein
MNSIKQQIFERINKDECFAIKDGEARVVAIMTGNYVMYGDVIEDVINSSYACKTVSDLCAGAKITLGSDIHVAFKKDGEVRVVRCHEFLMMFPIMEYKSPIAL